MKKLAFVGNSLSIGLVVVLASLLLSGCTGLEGVRRGQDPTPAQVESLTRAPAPYLRLAGSFPVMAQLRPLILNPGQNLLGHIDKPGGQGQKPEIIIYLDGWIDTPTTQFGSIYRAGRSFNQDERVLLIWGTVEWRLGDEVILQQPYSGNDTVWIRPYWPDPDYPTDKDLIRILGQQGSLFRVLAATIGQVYGRAVLERAANDPLPQVRWAASEALIPGQSQ